MAVTEPQAGQARTLTSGSPSLSLPPPDLERAISVVRAALGPTILPRDTDPVAGAEWLTELARRRSALAERLLSEADVLTDAAQRLLARVRSRADGT